MNLRHQRLICAAMLITLCLGLACKFYRGPASDWVNNWGPGSVCYVVLGILIASLCFPAPRHHGRIAVAAVAATCLIEFSQLLHGGWLDSLRAQPLGRLVLGNTFAWWDFPAYFMGGLVGWLLLRALDQWSRPAASDA